MDFYTNFNQLYENPQVRHRSLLQEADVKRLAKVAVSEKPAKPTPIERLGATLVTVTNLLVGR